MIFLTDLLFSQNTVSKPRKIFDEALVFPEFDNIWNEAHGKLLSQECLPNCRRHRIENRHQDHQDHDLLGVTTELATSLALHQLWLATHNNGIMQHGGTLPRRLFPIEHRV